MKDQQMKDQDFWVVSPLPFPAAETSRASKPWRDVYRNIMNICRRVFLEIPTVFWKGFNINRQLVVSLYPWKTGGKTIDNWWVKSCYKLIFSLQKWCCGSKVLFYVFFFQTPFWFEIFFWNGYPTEREKGRVLRDSWFGNPTSHQTKPTIDGFHPPVWPGLPVFVRKDFDVEMITHSCETNEQNNGWKPSGNQWYLFFETNDNNKHSLVELFRNQWELDSEINHENWEPWWNQWQLLWRMLLYTRGAGYYDLGWNYDSEIKWLKLFCLTEDLGMIMTNSNLLWNLRRWFCTCHFWFLEKQRDTAKAHGSQAGRGQDDVLASDNLDDYFLMGFFCSFLAVRFICLRRWRHFLALWCIALKAGMRKNHGMWSDSEDDLDFSIFRRQQLLCIQAWCWFQHQASHQLVWESQVAQDPWSRVSIKVRHLAWIPEVGWEAACIRWGRGGGFFLKKTQWKSVKNRGPPYCYWKKSRVDMVNIPLFIRVSYMLYTYPIIYQGFIHIISHYVPGFLYISKRVVVLTGISSPGEADGLRGKKPVSKSWSCWTSRRLHRPVDPRTDGWNEESFDKKQVKHKTPTADFFL